MTCGKPLATNQKVRDHAIFGLFGAHVNITDGRYVYMRGPKDDTNQPLYEYTLMPARMEGPFAVEEFANGVELSAPFPFTKGCPVLKIPTERPSGCG